jgi:hypothetical protein
MIRRAIVARPIGSMLSDNVRHSSKESRGCNAKEMDRRIAILVAREREKQQR